MRFLSLVILAGLLASCARMRPCNKVLGITRSEEVSCLPPEGQNAELFVQGPWPTSSWWQSFDDPQLNRLMEKGLRCSPNIAAANARARSASEEAKVQKSWLMPDLSFTVQDQWLTQSQHGPILGFFHLVPQTYNDTSVLLNFSYDLDLFGKNRKAYQAVLGEAMAKKAEVAEAARELSSHIASTYFTLQAHRESLGLEEALLQKTELILQLTKQSQNKGLATEITVDSAESVKMQVLDDIDLLKKLIAQDEHQLRVLIGEGPASCTTIHSVWRYRDQKLSLPGDIPLSILYRRPDLRAQLWYIQATAYKVGVAKAEFLPNINLTALGGVESIQIGNLFSFPSLTGQIVPTLSLPIFNGGRLQARLDQAVDNYEVAVADYNSLLLRTIQDVADWVSIIAAQAKQLQHEVKLVGLGEKDVRMVARERRAGLATQITLSQYEMELIQRRLVEVRVQGEQYRAYVGLVTALGGGF